jgi:hypothetical protein
LLAAQYPLSSDDTRLGIHRAIQYVHTDNMRAFRIGVFVPHPNHHMRPWVAKEDMCVTGAATTSIILTRRENFERRSAFRSEEIRIMIQIVFYVVQPTARVRGGVKVG